MSQISEISIQQAIQDLQNFTKHKVTLDKIANILGVSRQAISNRIARKSQLKDFEWEKLKEYFGCFDKQDYIDNLASGYAKKEVEKRVISPELKADLQKIYDEGIDLNWFILGKGNKYRAPEFEQVKDDLARRMEKMENALKNAGILTD